MSDSFDITYRNAAYYVSIPNYQGGKVYTAEYVERLHKEIEKSCDDGRFEDVSWSCPRAVKAEAERDNALKQLEKFQWQPIKTAPKDRPIMLCVTGFLPCAGRWWPIDGCWSSFDWEGHFESDEEASQFYNGSSYEPTHWMPLPPTALSDDKGSNEASLKDILGG